MKWKDARLMHDARENAKQGRGRGSPTDALFNRWNMQVFHKEIKKTQNILALYNIEHSRVRSTADTFKTIF